MDALFSSVILNLISIPIISLNFGANIFINGSNFFSILNVIVWSSILKSNCF